MSGVMMATSNTENIFGSKNLSENNRHYLLANQKRYYQSNVALTNSTESRDRSESSCTNDELAYDGIHDESTSLFSEKSPAYQKGSLFGAACTMTFVLQGSFLLAMPFVITTAGLGFIPIGILLFLLADYTSVLLIDCLYNTPCASGQRKRVRLSYTDIGRDAYGRWGGLAVTVTFACYIIFNNAVLVVLFGHSIYKLLAPHLPSLSETHILLIFSFLFLPSLFIRKMSILSFLSFAGAFCIIITSIICIVNFLQQSSRWSANIKHIGFKPEKFPLAFGLLMFSAMLNSILTQVETSMEKPKAMHTALHAVYTLTTIFKFTFGLLGALTFGTDTDQLVALNVSDVSMPSKYMLTVLLVVYSTIDVGVMYFVLFVSIDDFVYATISRRFSYDINKSILWLVLSRTFGLGICIIIALVLPYFALLAGAVGAITGTCLIFIFPVLFHLKLKWEEMSVRRKACELLALIVGIAIGLSSIYASLQALIGAALEERQ